MEVLAANGVEVMIPEGTDYTPTPAISHAILTYNRGRTAGLADGIVVTPSHNPPQDGGFKYNPPHGGPAGGEITSAVQARANELLGRALEGVRRVPYAQALRASTTHRHNFIEAYVADLANVIDFETIRSRRSARRRRSAGWRGRPLLGSDRRSLSAEPDGGQPVPSIRPSAS